MKSKNPQAMIQNLAKSNPNIANAIPVVEEIMKTSGNKQEVIQKACEKAGINPEQVNNQLKSMGININ